jgi:hypothetical protein
VTVKLYRRCSIASWPCLADDVLKPGTEEVLVKPESWIDERSADITENLRSQDAHPQLHVRPKTASVDKVMVVTSLQARSTSAKLSASSPRPSVNLAYVYNADVPLLAALPKVVNSHPLKHP